MNAPLKIEVQLQELANDAVRCGWDPIEIEERLTADLDAAIDRVGVPELSEAARELHGLGLVPPPIPEELRGLSRGELLTRRRRLVEAWQKTWAAADYRADKLHELAEAPDAAAAVDAVARWGPLDGRRVPKPLPAADAPAQDAAVSLASLHTRVLGY